MLPVCLMFFTFLRSPSGLERSNHQISGGWGDGRLSLTILNVSVAMSSNLLWRERPSCPILEASELATPIDLTSSQADIDVDDLLRMELRRQTADTDLAREFKGEVDADFKEAI
ncbi:hypothetical protein L1887_22357 [Cichorium endivia]|nr:hypothetical protein L1887_22357 [Cichorium endivia]